MKFQLNPSNLKKKRKKCVLLLLVSMMAAFISCDITEDVSENTIRQIYFKITDKGKKIYTDNDGVPIVDYGYVDSRYVGEQRNPVAICQKALEYYEDSQAGHEESKQLFLNCSDWLVNNVVYHGQYAVLEYAFDWHYGNMTAPWHSGMAQGQALQVMIRAHELTQGEIYLDTAKKMLNVFFVKVEDGGVTYKTDEGWWYEECADEGGEETRILNGMMFAVLGIYEYYEYTSDPDAQYLFDQGITALKNGISSYDGNGFSQYDLVRNSSEKYHEIHVQLLEQLYTITNEEIFKEYHDTWENYEVPHFMVRLIQDPTKMKYAIFGANFVGLFLIFGIIFFVIEKTKD